MNSMPFMQLKSFLKILIGVQYERKTAVSEEIRVPLFLLYESDFGRGVS